jgi:hypothetical protein
VPAVAVTRPGIFALEIKGLARAESGQQVAGAGKVIVMRGDVGRASEGASLGVDRCEQSPAVFKSA